MFLSSLYLLFKKCDGLGGGLRSLSALLVQSVIKSDCDVIPDDSKLLWTAPEILRDPDNSGTQAGDIYSFGIIAQEVLLQAEPFSLNKPPLTPSGIVEELKAPTGSVIRPAIPQGELCLYLCIWLSMWQRLLKLNILIVIFVPVCPK